MDPRLSVDIKADGVVLCSIALTTMAMVSYQRHAGETVFAALAAMEGGLIDPLRVVGMVRAMAQGDALSEDAVCSIVDQAGLVPVVECLGAAVQLAFPKAAKGDKSSEPGKRKAATGS